MLILINQCFNDALCATRMTTWRLEGAFWFTDGTTCEFVNYSHAHTRAYMLRRRTHWPISLSFIRLMQTNQYDQCLSMPQREACSARGMEGESWINIGFLIRVSLFTLNPPISHSAINHPWLLIMCVCARVSLEYACIWGESKAASWMARGAKVWPDDAQRATRPLPSKIMGVTIPVGGGSS